MRESVASESERAPRRRRRFFALTAVLLASLTAGAVASALWLKERDLIAPLWLRDIIAQQLENAAPDLQIQFGDLVAVVGSDWQPRLSVRDLRLSTQQGTEIVSVADVSGALDGAAVFRRQLQLTDLSASGVLMTLRRSENGAISLTAGAETAGAVTRRAPTVVQLVSDMEQLLLRPDLVALQSMDVRAITLRYEDLRAGRVWTVDGGRMRLDRQEDVLQLAMDVAVLGGASGVATISANYASVVGDDSVDIGLTIENLDARDVASQGPAFGWLAALQAPVSGSVRGGLTPDGGLKPLSAAFQIGAGIIQPTPETAPIPIDSAASYFSYLPQDQRLQFDELRVSSKWGSGRLEGQAVLDTGDGTQIENLVGQLRLTDLFLNPAEVYPADVQLETAELDFRLTLSPFSMEIGRLQVRDRGQILNSEGRIDAGPEGWQIAMDAQMDAISAPRLMEIWPESVKPKTRRWIAENVKAANIRDATAALRAVQGQRPDIYLAFNFDEGQFTFMRHMPPVTGAKGHASLVDNRFALLIDKGEVIAPEGGAVSVAGTSFIVPDTRAKPAPPGIVRLVYNGSVTSALSLLDQPPLRVMQKIDKPATLAEGSLEIEGTLSLPLKKGTQPDEVTYDVIGQITDVRSGALVRGRDLVAARLQVSASEDGVQISGAGSIDGVPVQTVWQQPIGPPGSALPGQVTGTIGLSPETLAAFNIALPGDAVRGESEAQFTVDLPKGAPARLSINSDLTGLFLSVPPVGWSKSAPAVARLDAKMVLGDNPRVDLLELDAPGLLASGDVLLDDALQLDRVRFDRVRIGDWFDAPVDLVGRGQGRPLSVNVRGGTIDFRRANLPQPSGGGRPGGPLNLALDRVQLTDTISLRNFRGGFSTNGGLSGSFEGAVNGGADVVGQVTPKAGRSALRITARDAGRILKSAGLLQQVRGGAIELNLVPVGTEGAFDGTLNVRKTRILDAPAIAALLNSISGVGLIDELNGDGIFFSSVDADFRLTPSRITLRQASAEGASMGLSMDGTFEPDTGKLQVQGVISPVYAFNSVGRVLTRRGEGLFGFNYSITGTADDPQVYVNPLTALAPGMMRNLFRGAQPEVPLEEGETRPPPKPRRKPVVTRGEDR